MGINPGRQNWDLLGDGNIGNVPFYIIVEL